MLLGVPQAPVKTDSSLKSGTGSGSGPSSSKKNNNSSLSSVGTVSSRGTSPAFIKMNIAQIGFLAEFENSPLRMTTEVKKKPPSRLAPLAQEERKNMLSNLKEEKDSGFVKKLRNTVYKIPVQGKTQIPEFQ